MSVEGDGRVNGAGPLVDSAGEGLDVVEALATQPHGDGKGTRAVVTDDDGRLIGVEFGVGAGGDLAHGNADGAGDACGFNLPGLADIEQDGGVCDGFRTNLRIGLRSNFRIDHCCEYKCDRP